MMAHYYRLCEGLRSKGILIPDTENIYDYINNENKDYYVSLYKYNEDHKKLFDEKKSVSGITDTVTNRLLWDFDAENNFEAVREDTLKLIDRLKDHGIDQDAIELFFSGNKGTHVCVNLEDELTPSDFKKITSSLADGLDTYDSTVSNPARIVRVAYTKHQNSSLFKVPLTVKQLERLSIEKIREYAITNKPIKESAESIHLPPSVVPEEDLKPEITSEPTLTQDLDLDYDHKPKWLSHWKYALLHGYFPIGTRSYALMILAATYRGQGLPKEVAYHACKGAAELQAKRFGEDKFEKEEIYNNVISQVYADTWNNGTYAEDNFPLKLKQYLTNLGVPRQEQVTKEEQQIELVGEGFKDFVNYAQDIDKYTMKFGIKELDERLKVRKGHLIGVIAPPGVGKTSLAITILNNMSKEGTHCYFGSYDMFRHNVYQKLIQRHTGLSEDALFDIYTKKNMKEVNKHRNILLNEYSNVSFCFKVGQTVQDLKDSIKLQEEKTGKTVELVVVDYLELILTKSTDPTAASAEAAQGLREIANEGKVVLMLLQPNKMSSKPNEPLLSYNAAKGSSSIAQAATAILTAHRPGLSSENPELDKFFSINCVKNRNGALFALDFGWQGKTQTLFDLSQNEKFDLKCLRETIQEAKANDF
jgi:KaiC/GvpD/RAD55 family RecA-like ATPase